MPNTYYADFTLGNDGNAGTIGSPWKYAIGMSGYSGGGSLSAGDSMLLKCGEKWRDTDNIPSSGSAGNVITFGIYGSGANPIIDGSQILSSWNTEGGGGENFLDGTGDKPISWWMFEDASTPSVDGNATNANDLTWVGGAARSSTHKQGSYALSEPSSGDGATRTFANLSANFPGKGATTDMTVGGWFYVVASPPDFTNILYLTDNSAKGFRFLTTTSGTIQIRFYKSGGGNAVGTSNSAVATGWHHLVGRWNGSGDDEVSLWIDGTKQTTVGTMATLALDTADSFTVGSGGVAPAVDLFDEVFIFAVALTDSQIGDIYTYGLAGGGGGTYYYATFADGTDQVFFDGVRLTKVASKNLLATGKWYWDTGNTRVYLYDDPTGHTVEATNLVWATPIYVNAKSYITIQDLTLQRGRDGIYTTGNCAGLIIQRVNSSYHYKDGLYAGSAGGVGMSNSTITNSTFSYNGNTGVNSSDYFLNNTISYNDIHHNCLFPDESWNGGIKLNLTNSGNDIIEHNTVHENSPLVTGDGNLGVGIWLDTVNSGTSYIRYNYVYNNHSHDIMVEACGSHSVYYNMVTNAALGYAYKNGIYGLGGVRGGDPGVLNANHFYNNTVYGVYNSAFEITSDQTGAQKLVTDNLVKNNIFINTSTAFAPWCFAAFYGGENDGTWGSGNVYTYNAFGPQKSNFIWWGTTSDIGTYAAWYALYAAANGNTVQTDPLFVNAGTDFHLQGSSPCINAGASVGLTQDYDGRAIIGLPDIGAFEYVAQTMSTKRIVQCG